jgi:predicted ATPase
MASGLMVGREVELDTLQRCLQAASTGQRQFVCITGAPEIVKTTV